MRPLLDFRAFWNEFAGAAWAGGGVGGVVSQSPNKQPMLDGLHQDDEDKEYRRKGVKSNLVAMMKKKMRKK
jgi:hypothetical protein